MPGEPTPVSTLIELMGSSPAVFADVVADAAARLTAEPPQAAGHDVPIRRDLISLARPGVLVMPAGDEAAAGRGPRDATGRRSGRRGPRRPARSCPGLGPGASPRDRVLTADPDEALTAAAQRAFAALGGPLLIAWPELPVWRPVHGDGALTDLADGCGVAVGPIFDGGFYLLAFAELLPALLEVPRSLDAMNRAFAAAHEAEVGIGLLRPERGLRSAGDVAAALADPLLDDELRGLLS